MSSQQEGWPFVASIVYTTAWSVSFYGQVYQNYIHKSVQGLSMDYIAMNLAGYIFYGFYSSLGYFLHWQGAGTVVLADLVFVYHALLMVFLWILQSCLYTSQAYPVLVKR